MFILEFARPATTINCICKWYTIKTHDLLPDLCACIVELYQAIPMPQESEYTQIHKYISILGKSVEAQDEK